MPRAARRVSVIPERQGLSTGRTEEHPRLRVAAYCRVSTEQEQQQNSYEAQVTYYTQYIQNNPNWEFAGIFADDGKTGTNTEHRDDFQRLLEECRKGNIDLIMTKSVARFARNTVDSIVTIRELKAMGIAVYFETEYIQNRLYLAEPLNIACFILVKYNILCFAVAGNQGFVSIVACLSLKSIT